MITVRHISKSFSGTRALKDLCFEVSPGECLGLLGPNGAGKTTSLRMLCGLLKPDSGEIRIDGINVTQSPQKCQQLLGVLPDNCGLYTRLTAEENILYFAELYGLPKSTAKARIAQLSDQLDMGAILHRKTSGFSQGERMKVALSRALVHEPPYLILDEPTNGLDVLTTRAVRQLLQAQVKKGAGLIFSSHLMHEVSHLCDQLSIVIAGEIAAQGTCEEITQQSGAADLESAFASFCGESLEHD